MGEHRRKGGRQTGLQHGVQADDGPADPNRRRSRSCGRRLRGVAPVPDGADIRTLMDRTLWARFGETTLKAPHAVQWLSDNGPQYTATATVLYAHELGLVPITTPAYSSESNPGVYQAGGKSTRRPDRPVVYVAAP